MRTDKRGFQTDNYFSYAARNVYIKREDAEKQGLKRIENMTMKRNFNWDGKKDSLPEEFINMISNTANAVRRMPEEVILAEIGVKQNEQYEDTTLFKVSYIVFVDQYMAGMFSMRNNVGMDLFSYNFN